MCTQSLFNLTHVISTPASAPSAMHIEPTLKVERFRFHRMPILTSEVRQHCNQATLSAAMLHLSDRLCQVAIDHPPCRHDGIGPP
eukprot:45534-Eustigmatos_ZCMA.PRE.1